MEIIISLVGQLLSTKMVEDLVAKLVQLLLKASDGGISNELAHQVIKGISDSNRNVTTEDLFKDALEVLENSIEGK